MHSRSPTFRLAVAAAAFITAAGAQAQDWKIGFITPTTGPATTVGTRQLATVRWWEGEVNSAKGIKGRKVQVIHCNDEGNPAKAVTCARDLLAQGVVLLINGSVSGAIRATMPLLKNGPVMLTPAPGILPDAASYVFQTSPSDTALTTAVAEYARANRVAQLGVITATDASGELGTASAAAVFPKQGVKYTLARIDLRATDATTQLTRVAGPETSLLYSTYTGAGAATVVKSYANLGLTQPLIVSYANISDPFIALIKDDMPQRLLGVALRSVAPELLADPAERQRSAYFTKSYEQSHGGERPDMINMLALGMVDTAAAVLRDVADPSNADEVKRYLESTPVRSVQTLRFSRESHIGLGAADVVVVELKNGRWAKADALH
ncbi:MAG: ABC transporter substrate-binding protein [Pseudomonadota bacterium]